MFKFIFSGAGAAHTGGRHKSRAPPLAALGNVGQCELTLQNMWNDIFWYASHTWGYEKKSATYSLWNTASSSNYPAYSDSSYVQAYSGQVQVGLLAVPPEQDGGARMRSGHRLAVHQQADEDPRHQDAVQQPHQDGGQHPVHPAPRVGCKHTAGLQSHSQHAVNSQSSRWFSAGRRWIQEDRNANERKMQMNVWCFTGRVITQWVKSRGSQGYKVETVRVSVQANVQLGRIISRWRLVTVFYVFSRWDRGTFGTHQLVWGTHQHRFLSICLKLFGHFPKLCIFPLLPDL